MTPHEWSCRAVASLVAWSVVLALFAMAGHALDFQFWSAVMGWGLVGLVLMSGDSTEAPLPAGTHVLM